MCRKFDHLACFSVTLFNEIKVNQKFNINISAIYLISNLLERKIARMFCLVTFFLCRIGLSLSSDENPYDKSVMVYRNYTNNEMGSNGSISTLNITQSFGDETMRSAIKILSKQKNTLEEVIELHRKKLNNTITSDQSYIIFNRVAKSGSETVRSIISILSKKNNFTMVRDQHSESIMSEEKRKYLFDLWKSSEFHHSPNGKKQ